jgi:DNA-directed RNA polymerase beta subunit
MKKVIQVPYTNNMYSLDKKYYLVSKERQLVRSMAQDVTRQVSNPYGHNLLVAITMNSGFQQEDSLSISERVARYIYQ